MTEIGQKVTLAKGGEGGKGNAFFKTSTKSPPTSELARPNLPTSHPHVSAREKLPQRREAVELPHLG